MKIGEFNIENRTPDSVKKHNFDVFQGREFVGIFRSITPEGAIKIARQIVHLGDRAEVNQSEDPTAFDIRQRR